MFYDSKNDGLWFKKLDNNLIYLHFSKYPDNSEFRKVGKELVDELKKYGSVTYSSEFI